MNGWLLAAIVLLLGGTAPAILGVATGPVRRRVLAQNLATLTGCLVLLLLAQGYGRSAYLDSALVLAVLGPAGTLIYARLFAEELVADPPRGRASDVLAVVASAAVVVPLCVVTDPGRATVKLLVIGTLLVAGNLISSRALRHSPPPVPPATEGAAGHG
ncbi:monovalent cation/H+ antiporter complex subunit F [Streptomyces sp. NPDC088261]|uniref:monovalent cation/H+ antiporter complex subunit F n=1 Tax=Streptomyces sp. NPDC088261 TaxID=3365851 RepID=UPI003816BFB8